MNALINFITGKKTAWVTLLIGLFFAVLAFGPLRAATVETAPTNGLSETSETALVSKALENLPGADATAGVPAINAFALATASASPVASTRIHGADFPGFAVPCPMRANTFWPIFVFNAFFKATLKNKTDS